MSRGYLLDSRFLSILGSMFRSKDEQATVREWFLANGERLYLPTLTVAQIAEDIGTLTAVGAGLRASRQAAWLQDVLAWFPDRVLDFDVESALHMRSLSMAAQGQEAAVKLSDMLVACMAVTHGLVVLTRNPLPFRAMQVACFNPLDQNCAEK